MQIKPEVYYFKDDGHIPNSKYPLLVYRNIHTAAAEEGAAWLENKFASNDWTNSWRNGIYSYLHYHSTAHEVLGTYKGHATVQLGGENGEILKVSAGDILVIPAGVGHEKKEASEDFGVVGAYANGMDYDILKGKSTDRVRADLNMLQVPFPSHDPLLGKDDGLRRIWIPE